MDGLKGGRRGRVVKLSVGGGGGVGRGKQKDVEYKIWDMKEMGEGGLTRWRYEGEVRKEGRREKVREKGKGRGVCCVMVDVQGMRGEMKGALEGGGHSRDGGMSEGGLEGDRCDGGK